MTGLLRTGTPHLVLSEITKRFGATHALKGVSLEVLQGELLCLLGPSGCGKTTLLNIIGGLAEPDSGSVHLGGRDITRLALQKRNIGLVFQSYALFPHLTVAANIAFGMEVRGKAKPEIDKRIAELLVLTRLDGKGGRYPRQLSGGEQQRVALARALAIDPDLLLLDEPFSNLDAKLRIELRAELSRVQRQSGVTMVLVTHDQDEAFALGDRVALMHAGRLIQLGTPEQLYANPESEFAARFVGDSNIFEGRFESLAGKPGLRCDGEWLPLSEPPGQDGILRLLVRPEHCAITGAGAGGIALAGTVEMVTYRGNGWLYDIETRLGRVLLLEGTGQGRRAEIGATVFVGWQPGNAYLLPAREPVEQ